jgi:hypothetical protein
VSGAPRVAQLARDVFNRAAIAAGTSDKELALEVCRELGEIESSYTLWAKDRLLETPGTERPTDRPGASLRKMAAKWPGRCSKCARAISVGTLIAYDGATRRAFHEECA